MWLLFAYYGLVQKGAGASLVAAGVSLINLTGR